MKTLIRCFMAFMALVSVYEFTTRKYLNPYKLYLVFGKKGSGKSTYLVKLAKKHLKKRSIPSAASTST